MMSPASRYSLLVALLPLVTGCAAETATDDTTSSEEALSSFASAEVVGALRSDMEAVRAEASVGSGFRAFQFEAHEGSELSAYVVATSGVDPIAYVLGADKRMLTRNDNRGTSTRDAEVRFKAPRTGTYYLAFRTKERRPATVVARLLTTSSIDLERTGTYVDGWPIRSPWGQPDQRVFDVSPAAVGTTIANHDGCPTDPFVAGRGQTLSTGVSVRVDLAARRVSMTAGNAGGSAPIADDGTFALENNDGRWGRVSARGRIAPGGVVVLDAAETVACRSNYDGASVYDATRVTNAIGAANPR